MAILSSLHSDVEVPSEDNPKHKPDSVLYYNQTNVGVDVFDQMTRMHSVKAGSRRWPVHAFYNVIDMALINSWVIYKKVCQSKISRREYIQKVAEELTGCMTSDSLKNVQEMTAVQPGLLQILFLWSRHVAHAVP